MEELIWHINSVLKIVVQMGLIGCIYKYLTKREEE
tara:strand:- start:981 stop:1085 length:105 start_codon:yes stop_codon:yes gene_type:complete